MWIPDVRVFSPKRISALTVDILQAGIERRLAILTYLFCPEEEIEPTIILNQLRIENAQDGQLQIRWRPRMRYPPRGYRFGEELKDQLQMASYGLRSYPAETVAEARRIIDAAVDGVGFIQGYTRDNMGWPVVMAAAATIVEQAGGAIVTNGYGWFVPAGNEVQLFFDPNTDQSA